MEVAKLNTAVSFKDDPKPDKLQLTLLVEFLQDAITNNIVIDKEQINKLYVDYMFREGSPFIIWVTGMPITRKAYIVHKEKHAMNWFVRWLGAAIIKGKFLIIPIIKLE